jgi:hypothetical protein
LSLAAPHVSAQGAICGFSCFASCATRIACGCSGIFCAFQFCCCPACLFEEIASAAAGATETNPCSYHNFSTTTRTRLQDNIRKPKVYTDGIMRYGLLSEVKEPTSLQEALSSET